MRLELASDNPTAVVAIAAVALVMALGLSGAVTWMGLLGVLLVQPINFASLAFIALRTRTLTNGDIPWWPGLKGACLSATLLYVLPSRLSELAKPVYLAEKCGISIIRGVAVVAVERFVDIVIVSAALGIGVILLANTGLEFSLAVWGAITFTGIAGSVVLLKWPHLLHRAIAVLPWRFLRETITSLVLEVRSAISPERLPMAFLWGALTWAASFTMVHVLLNFAGSIPLSMAQTFLVFLAGTVGIAIAVAPGGLGTFEAGIVVALSVLGYEVSEALALSLLLRAANLGITPMLAAWAVAHDGFGLLGLIDKLRKSRVERAATEAAPDHSDSNT